MISETVLLWLGTMALLIDYAGLQVARQPLDKTVAFMFALLFWLAFTMNALGYNKFAEAGGLRQEAQSLAIIGLLASIITFVLLVRAAFTVINTQR